MNGRPARHTKERTPQASSRPQNKIATAAATDTNQSPVSAPTDVYPHIAKRAYEIHAERGFRQGYALDEWLEAEREVLNRNRER